MKARHEFESDAAYMEYLRLYYAGSAIRAIYPIVPNSSNLSYEEDLARRCVKVANSMIKVLYPSTKDNSLSGEKPKEKGRAIKPLYTPKTQLPATAMADHARSVAEQPAAAPVAAAPVEVPRPGPMIPTDNTHYGNKQAATTAQKAEILKLANRLSETEKSKIIKSVNALSISKADALIFRMKMIIEARQLIEVDPTQKATQMQIMYLSSLIETEAMTNSEKGMIKAQLASLDVKDASELITTWQNEIKARTQVLEEAKLA
jgi:hypothetical protein